MPEPYDSRTMKGGRVFLRIRVVESEGLRLAARTSAHAHIAEGRDDVAPPGYFACDTVELLQADGTAASISILTDFTRTDLYLWISSIDGVPAGISTPQTMTHGDDHFPLHPLNEHEILFQVMGLSLETLESWGGHTICLETDKKLSDLLKPPPQQETVDDRVDKNQAISTVEEEPSSPKEGEEERVGEGTIPKSEGALVVHDGVKIEVPSGRGEDAMHVDKSTLPEVRAEYREWFEDFNDPPLWGQDPQDLEKEFGVTIKVLDDKPDALSGSYAIRVSGSLTGVSAFSKEFYSHPPPGLSSRG